MKHVMAPIEVEVKEGRPVRVRYERGTYIVRRILDTWVVEGRWWACEVRRYYFRLLTDRGTLDVYRSGEGWVLSRVLD